MQRRLSLPEGSAEVPVLEVRSATSAANKMGVHTTRRGWEGSQRSPRAFPALVFLAHRPTHPAAGPRASPRAPRPLAGPERAAGRRRPSHTHRAVAAREACAARATHRPGGAGGAGPEGGRGPSQARPPRPRPSAPCVPGGARCSRPDRGSFNPGKGAGRRGRRGRSEEGSFFLLFLNEP